MILGLAGFFIANLAVALGAKRLVHASAASDAPQQILLFQLFRITIISGVILFAGAVGLLKPVPLGLFGCCALALLWWFRNDNPFRWPRLTAPNSWISALWIFVAARLLLQVWFFSPYLGDSLNYYLPKVAEWVQSGYFTRGMGSHPHVTLPAGFELIETWWVVFFHHDVLIEAAGIEFLFLAAAAIYLLATSLGLSPNGASFAALIYVLSPGIHLSTTSCLNDVPAASVIVCLFALILNRMPAAYLFMTAGLGIGIKPTVGFAVPGLALLYFLTKKELSRSTRCVGVEIGMGLAGGILGVVWYVRNYLWYGNPIYPIASADKPVFPPPQFGPKTASLFGSFSDLVNTRIYDRHAYGPLVDDSAGWGVVAFGCGLVALLLGCLEDPRMRRLAAGFGLSLLSVLLLCIHDAWCLKYVFFFPALLAVAIAGIGERMPLIKGLVFLGLGVEFMCSWVPFDLPVKDVRILASQPWRGRSVAPLSNIDTREPSLGVWGAIEGEAYLLYRPDFSRRVVYLKPTSPENFLSQAREQNVSLIFAVPSTEDERKMLDRLIAENLLKGLGRNHYRITERNPRER